MDEEDDVVICARCAEAPASINCSCGPRYCDDCFALHIAKLPAHRGTPHTNEPTKFQKAWKFVKGIGGTADFERDEGAKWFGLVEERRFDPPVCRIVETPRLADLLELSKYADEHSPQRQFPSLVSFLGDTGAGKSTLGRYLRKYCSEARLTRRQ